MKKLFKALSAVTVAAAMSFSAFAFSACAEPEPEPQPKPNTGLSTGNETYDNIINTLDYEALSFVSTTDAMGEQAQLSAKFNFDGTADFSIESDYYTYAFMRNWKVYGLNTETEITDFTQAELKGWIDIPNEIQNLAGMAGGMTYAAEPSLGSFDFGAVVQGGLSAVNYAVLSLADAAGAVTEGEGKVTVDINLLAYNMVQDAKSVLNSLNANTTLGELLNNQKLKKYAQILTELISTQELIYTVNALASAFGSMGGPITYEEGADGMQSLAPQVFRVLAKLLNDVSPDANSSVYDYIVKILSSDNLVTEINGLFGETVLNGKVTDITLGQIVEVIGEEDGLDFDEFKLMLSSYIETAEAMITATKITVPDMDSEYAEDDDEQESVMFSLENAKLVYNYDGDGLVSMSFSASINAGGIAMEIEDTTLTFQKQAYAQSEFTALPATLPVIEPIDWSKIFDKEDAIPVITVVAGERPTVVSVPRGDFKICIDLSNLSEDELDEYGGACLNIFELEADVVFSNGGDYSEILENYYYTDGETIECMYVGGHMEGEVEVSIWAVPSEQSSEIELDALTVGVPANFTVAAGKSLGDEGECAYFKLEVSEAGFYSVQINGFESVPYVELGGLIAEGYFGGYELDDIVPSEDDGTYWLMEGVIYIKIYNTDINNGSVDGNGSITVLLVSNAG